VLETVITVGSKETRALVKFRSDTSEIGFADLMSHCRMLTESQTEEFSNLTNESVTLELAHKVLIRCLYEHINNNM
jgi:hypothetical protein